MTHRLVWHGRLDDRHELRVLRTGVTEGHLVVLSLGGAELLREAIPLPPAGLLGAEDVGAWEARAERAVAERAA